MLFNHTCASSHMQGTSSWFQCFHNKFSVLYAANLHICIVITQIRPRSKILLLKTEFDTLGTLFELVFSNTTSLSTRRILSFDVRQYAYDPTIPISVSCFRRLPSAFTMYHNWRFSLRKTSSDRL